MQSRVRCRRIRQIGAVRWLLRLGIDEFLLSRDRQSAKILQRADVFDVDVRRFEFRSVEPVARNNGFQHFGQPPRLNLLD